MLWHMSGAQQADKLRIRRARIRILGRSERVELRKTEMPTMEMDQQGEEMRSARPFLGTAWTEGLADSRYPNP